MGTQTLNQRSSGQIIQDFFFNDLTGALSADFMGRNSSGVPTSGQNLGTLALPWGTIYGTTLNLGGSTLDTSKIVSPANRIVSGKVRTTSNQPAFITPNGAAASCLIAGATTNLVLAINGAAVTVSTDITKASLTTAPSTQNTATVNDATAAAQVATKTWGEVGNNNGTNTKITITGAGTQITSLVGKFAAFKIVHSAVTEYFTAFVESSTILSHCMRGFFYDSSLNPVNPVAISNSDTITLMKLGYVFMTNDGTTVDVTYNAPFWGASSASLSPVTGDYWYDTVNSVWKRYDGASFQIINRVLIGMVVMDSTNCVAARCIDFYKAYSPHCSLEVEIGTTVTNAQAKRQLMSVNVSGNEIYFGSTLPTWVGSTNYATSSTDYYSAFTTSTTYYLYVKDDGTLTISDMAPYYRPDLYGFYHHHNPWRCVAIAATDGSSNWTWCEQIPAVAANVVAIRSSVVCDSANGHGGTNNKINRFTNSVTTGTAITYLDSAANGASFTINEDGIYAMSHNNGGSGAGYVGISNNSNQLTTGIASITAVNCVCLSYCPTNLYTCASATIICKAGDVIRPHDDGAAAGTVQLAKFTITKIG